MSIVNLVNAPAPTIVQPADTLANLDTVLRVIGLDHLARLSAGLADLVFADPPFNIGHKYDEYSDRHAEGRLPRMGESMAGSRGPGAASRLAACGLRSVRTTPPSTSSCSTLSDSSGGTPLSGTSRRTASAKKVRPRPHADSLLRPRRQELHVQRRRDPRRIRTFADGRQASGSGRAEFGRRVEVQFGVCGTFKERTRRPADAGSRARSNHQGFDQSRRHCSRPVPPDPEQL